MSTKPVAMHASRAEHDQFGATLDTQLRVISHHSIPSLASQFVSLKGRKSKRSVIQQVNYT